MKFYRGNRIDAEFEASPGELAVRFWASQQGEDVAKYGLPLDRGLRSWLTASEGLNSTWDDEAGYQELYQLVFGNWPREATDDSQPWRTK